MAPKPSTKKADVEVSPSREKKSGKGAKGGKSAFKSMNKERLLFENKGRGIKLDVLLKDAWNATSEYAKERYVEKAKEEDDSEEGGSTGSPAKKSGAAPAKSGVVEDTKQTIFKNHPMAVLQLLLVGQDLTSQLMATTANALSSMNASEKLAVVKELLNMPRKATDKGKLDVNEPLALSMPMIVKNTQIHHGTLLHFAVAMGNVDLVSELTISSRKGAKAFVEEPGYFSIRASAGLASVTTADMDAKASIEGNPLILAHKLHNFYSSLDTEQDGIMTKAMHAICSILAKKRRTSKKSQDSGVAQLTKEGTVKPVVVKAVTECPAAEAEDATEDHEEPAHEADADEKTKEVTETTDTCGEEESLAADVAMKDEEASEVA